MSQFDLAPLDEKDRVDRESVIGLIAYLMQNAWTPSKLEGFTEHVWVASFPTVDTAIRWLSNLPEDLRYEVHSFLVLLWRRYESTALAVQALTHADKSRREFSRFGASHIPLFVCDEKNQPLAWEVLVPKAQICMIRFLKDSVGDSFTDVLATVFKDLTSVEELRILFADLPAC